MRSPGPTVLLALLLVAGFAGAAACSTPAPTSGLPATAIQVRRVLSHADPGEPDPFTTEAGAELIHGREGTRAAGAYWVGPPELDGTAIATADLVEAELGWKVRLTLTSAGSAAYVAFADFFTDPRVAIVVDGQVVSAPTIIGDPIDSSAIDIDGNGGYLDEG